MAVVVAVVRLVLLQTGAAPPLTRRLINTSAVTMSQKLKVSLTMSALTAILPNIIVVAFSSGMKAILLTFLLTQQSQIMSLLILKMQIPTVTWPPQRLATSLE